MGATPDVLESVAALVEGPGGRPGAGLRARAQQATSWRAVRKVKKAYPDVQLIAGNIATAEARQSFD
ncbi:MAG: hypothetical protein ACLT1K_04675 [[Clostridium] leptum]